MTARTVRPSGAAVIVAVIAIVLGAGLWANSRAVTEPPASIVVAAAASMSTVLDVARAEFEQLHPNVRIHFNFASTGTLQRQIEAGAPIDLFIAAAQQPVDRLIDVGLVQADEVTTVAYNEMVLIATKGRANDLHDWADLLNEPVRRIAIGNPQHVPAGQYARTALQSLELWNALQPRIVLAENVRQVVNYVARGEVDAGIVYSSDTVASDRVRIVAPAPKDSHPLVTYPMVIPGDAPSPEAARSFAKYLLSERGQQLLIDFGFTSIDVACSTDPVTDADRVDEKRECKL